MKSNTESAVWKWSALLAAAFAAVLYKSSILELVASLTEEQWGCVINILLASIMLAVVYLLLHKLKKQGRTSFYSKHL